MKTNNNEKYMNGAIAILNFNVRCLIATIDPNNKKIIMDKTIVKNCNLIPSVKPITE